MQGSPLKTLIGHLLALFIFFVINTLYFSTNWERLITTKGDTMEYIGAFREIAEYNKDQGRPLLWTNALFGGMPSYQISYHAKGYYLDYVYSVFTLQSTRQVVNFFGLMTAYYVFLLLIGITQNLSIVGAIAFGFSTGHFLLYQVGHQNKLLALIGLPLIAASLFLMFYKKRYLFGTSLFGLAIATNIRANHIQMTYYFAICIAVLGIIWLIESYKSKSYTTLVKTIAFALLASILAIGANASLLWPTYEYAQESVRGKAILSKQVQVGPTDRLSTPQQNASNKSGFDYQYAMSFSNGLQDLFAALIPRAAGGGSKEQVNINTLKYITNTQQGESTSDGKKSLPIYWGSLPSTTGPYYFGAVVLFLFLFGAFLTKGPIKWWIIASVILTTLLSMGSNADPIQKLFFDYLPLYNKFRAPNSILSITTLFMPLLGVYALSGLFKGIYSKEEAKRALFMAGGIAGGIALLFALFGPSLFQFTGPADINITSSPKFIQELTQERKHLLTRDSWRTIFFVGSGFLLLWAYLQNKLKETILIPALGILILVDLWGIGLRYVKPNTMTTMVDLSQKTTPSADDAKIIRTQSGRGSYRVLDKRYAIGASNTPSYYHNSIGGYHAAKLRRYQDIIDRHLSRQNLSVLNMLNTKFIYDKTGTLFRNQSAFGPAWFVDTVLIVNTPDAEIAALDTINTRNMAVVLDREFKGYINTFDPVPGGSINLIRYDPQHMVYQTDAPTEQLAIFSEIWYGPNKGWQAYIDGEPVDHVRANYILRAMRVPAGKHRIEFIFDPQSVKIGTIISKISSLTLLLGFLSIGGYHFWNWIKVLAFPVHLPAQPKEPIQNNNTPNSIVRPQTRKQNKR